jgi:hypothetical protein
VWNMMLILNVNIIVICLGTKYLASHVQFSDRSRFKRSFIMFNIIFR